MHDLGISAIQTNAPVRKPARAATSVGRRVALFGGAAAFAIVAVAMMVSPSPAANSSPLNVEAPTSAQAPVLQAALPQPEAQAPEPDYIRASGKIGPDLTAALQQAKVPDRIGREYVRLLARAIPLSDGLSIEDKFDLVYEPGEKGRLLYVGLDRIARADIELLKWTDGKEVVWINADGVGGSTSQNMRLPVSGRVSSGFGNRFHPILGSARFHKGVDLAAGHGTPIVAAADGRVVSAGWSGGYGQRVAIAHSGGIQTMYGHMSRIVAAAGTMVRQGQLIGYVGSTGLSTGPHLHYEVLKGGRPVNPLSVKLAAAPAHLEGAKLHEFRGQLRSLMMLPPKRS